MMSAEDVLPNRYALIDARVVLDGRWANARRATGGSAARLIPLLWFLSSGGGFCTENDSVLRDLSGLSRPAYLTALVDLHATDLVALHPSCTRDSLRFRPGAHVLASRSGERPCRRCFVLPKPLFALHRWRLLSGSECCVMIAIAGSVETRLPVWNQEYWHYREGRDLAIPETMLDEVRDLFEFDEDDERFSDDADTLLAPRASSFSQRLIAARAGVDVGCASRAVQTLTEMGLLTSVVGREGTAVQLPGDVWDVRRSSRRRALDGRCAVRAVRPL